MTTRWTSSACTPSAARSARSAPAILMSAGLGGVGYAEGVSMGEQVVRQITATLTAFAWSGVGSLIIYKVIDATIGLRVTEEQERDGLDVSEHGEMAYHG